MPPYQNALAPGVSEPPPRNGFQNALGAFARGFIGPEGVAKIEDRRFELKQREDAGAKEKLAKTKAWLEQTKEVPEVEREAWTMQNADAIFRDTGQRPAMGQGGMGGGMGASPYADAELDKAIAAMSAQLGQGPAPPAEGYTLAPGAQRYGADNQMVSENPRADPSRAPTKPDIREGANGNYFERDPNTGIWKDTGVKAPPPSAGVTINMPGNIREGVDDSGRPVFAGIDPKNPDAGYQPLAGVRPQSTLMGAETRGKFLSMAPNAYKSIDTLRKQFGKGGDDPLSGVDDVTAQIFSHVPFGAGEPAARMIGGQNWQDFDQAWNTIELGVHIPSGAAVTPSEAQRFLRANKPALGESNETIMRKIDNVERFYKGLEAGFRGDFNALNSLMGGAAPAQSSPQAPELPPDLSADAQAMIEELRSAGKTDAEIQAIISGQ